LDAILENLPGSRQVLLFSATQTKKVRLHEPFSVSHFSMLLFPCYFSTPHFSIPLFRCHSDQEAVPSWPFFHASFFHTPFFRATPTKKLRLPGLFVHVSFFRAPFLHAPFFSATQTKKVRLPGPFSEACLNRVRTLAEVCPKLGAKLV
jgi:hypothetical protein